MGIYVLPKLDDFFSIYSFLFRLGILPLFKRGLLQRCKAQGRNQVWPIIIPLNCSSKFFNPSLSSFRLFLNWKSWFANVLPKKHPRPFKSHCILYSLEKDFYGKVIFESWKLAEFRSCKNLQEKLKLIHWKSLWNDSNSFIRTTLWLAWR